MIKWYGRKEFESLTRDKALQKYLNRKETKPNGYLANIAKITSLTLMRNSLINYFGYTEQEILED